MGARGKNFTANATFPTDLFYFGNGCCGETYCLLRLVTHSTLVYYTQSRSIILKLYFSDLPRLPCSLVRRFSKHY